MAMDSANHRKMGCGRKRSLAGGELHAGEEANPSSNSEGEEKEEGKKYSEEILGGVPCSSCRLSPATRPNASDTAANKMRRTCYEMFKNVTFTISLKYTKIQIPRLPK